MKKNVFFAKNKFNLIAEISTILIATFFVINNKIPFFGIDYKIILVFVLLVGVSRVIQFFEKISIDSDGVTYNSLFRKILIQWENIENVSAYHQINKRDLERLYLEDLANFQSDKSLFEKIFSYSNQITLYISVQPDFFPTKWTPISEKYMHFYYTPEILEEIQKWLLMLNKNV